MIKKNNGFTLLEIIISIAALSLISVVILQLFLAASNLNDRARDTDIAVNLSITEIERLKGLSSVGDYTADGLGTVSESADAMTVSYYYDEEWKPVDSSVSVPDQVKYRLTMDITKDESPPAELSGMLYSIRTDVTDLTAKTGDLTLASLQTKKYFPGNAKEGGL